MEERTELLRSGDSASTSSQKYRNLLIFTLGVGLLVILVLFIVLAISFSKEPQPSAQTNSFDKIVLNEVMFFSSTNECWVEITNLGEETLDISGEIIKLNEVIVQIKSQSYLEPNEYFVIHAPNCPKADLPVISNGTSLYSMNVELWDSQNNLILDSIHFDLKSWEVDKPFYRDTFSGKFSYVQGARSTPGLLNNDASSTNFEVYIFNVGQGDSQLIRFPSGYTIFIDLSEDNWNTKKNADAIVKKLDAILGNRKINVGIITHLHLDHLGYYGYGGFYALVETYGYQFDKILDRDAGAWVDYNKDGKCDPDTEIAWKYAGTFSGTATKWLCYATDPRNTKIYKVRQAAQLCSTTQINPPDNGAQVQVVSADALGALTLSGQIISADRTKDRLPPSENDYSIGINIRFGDIEYATLGDLDGDYASSQNGYIYNDVEKVAAPRIGEVDIYRANHHGSGHSSNTPFVNTLNPQVSLISCGAGNTYGHPDQDVLNRLLLKGDVWLTNKCDTKRNYGKSRFANGDIKISSSNGRTFTVEGGGASQMYTAKSKAGKKTSCVVPK